MHSKLPAQPPCFAAEQLSGKQTKTSRGLCQQAIDALAIRTQLRLQLSPNWILFQAGRAVSTKPRRAICGVAQQSGHVTGYPGFSGGKQGGNSGWVACVRDDQQRKKCREADAQFCIFLQYFYFPAEWHAFKNSSLNQATQISQNEFFFLHFTLVLVLLIRTLSLLLYLAYRDTSRTNLDISHCEKNVTYFLQLRFIFFSNQAVKSKKWVQMIARFPAKAG